jgi:hypothetical protein
MDEPQSNRPGKLSLRMGVFAELSLATLAIGLSFLGVYDRRQPFSNMGWRELQDAWLWGLISSLPLLSYLVVFHVAPATSFSRLRQFCFDQLRPLFDGASISGLALLSIAAGIGEELLFRWSLQGGLSTLLEYDLGTFMANFVGLFVASLVFGLCHAITKIYFLLTFLGGLFLGWIMIHFENWMVPAVAHAVYDFVALVYLVRIFQDPRAS